MNAAAKKATAVALGEGHMLLLTEEGVVYGYGDNSKGQLGKCDAKTHEIELPEELKGNVDRIVCGYDRSFLISKSQEVYSFGDNAHGELGHSLDDVKCSEIRKMELPDKIGESKEIVQKVLFSKTIVRKLQEFFQEAIVDYW
jgi:alpha-tubulin suppressor-like RCC1 family protein